MEEGIIFAMYVVAIVFGLFFCAVIPLWLVVLWVIDRYENRHGG